MTRLSLRTILILIFCLLTIISSFIEAAQYSESTKKNLHKNSVTLANEILSLTLTDAVAIGLRNNRSIHSAYLERVAQKFDLIVEEDRYRPKLVISARNLSLRNQNDRYRRTEIIPQTTLLTEYGTRLSLSWSNQLTIAEQAGRSRNDGASLAIIQPLLKGAGRDIATAPLRLAKLREKANLLALKSTVSGTITKIIIGYREVLRSQEQLQIAKKALDRSKDLLEANKVMIASGRMAAFEIVQTEADVVNQELNVEEASNQLDTSRLHLLSLLAIDLATRVVAVDKLEAYHFDLDLNEALLMAQQKQPDYLMQLIISEEATLALAIAQNERLWDVSLIGGATQVRDHYSTDDGKFASRAWEGYAGIQVDVPIGDLSRKQAEVHARVNVDNQEIKLSEYRQSLERSVRDSVRDLGTRWRQYEISQRARDLSLKKLNVEREKLQAGRSSNFQVLSFETDLRNAESARLNALIAYLNTQAVVDETFGTTLDSWDINLHE
nr:TolC family protein [Pseudomonas luteola]